MAIIKIEEIEIVTKGGWTGRIVGLQDDKNMLAGWIRTESDPHLKVFWDENGTASNQPDTVNIDRDQTDIGEVVSTAKVIFRR